jgi:hypothetical protein
MVMPVSVDTKPNYTLDAIVKSLVGTVKQSLTIP